MLKVKARPLTRHDYAALPEGPPFAQILDGEYHMSPSPSRRHQEILRNLALPILSYLEKKPGGECFFAPLDVFLGEINVFQPDLFFFTEARRSLLHEHGAEGAPDLVVEILSPSNALIDRGVKKEVYARHGVEELWLIDPGVEEVQVFRLRDNADTPVAVLRAPARLTTPLLPGLDIPVARVFAGPQKGPVLGS